MLFIYKQIRKMGWEVQKQEVQKQSDSFTYAVSTCFQTWITGDLKEQNSSSLLKK